MIRIGFLGGGGGGGYRINYIGDPTGTLVAILPTHR